MTNPFHSILGTSHNVTDNPLVPQGERDERNLFAEAVAEDIRADELAAISTSFNELPFVIKGLSARIETGICAAAKKAVGFDRPPSSGPGGMLVESWPLRQRGRRSRST